MNNSIENNIMTEQVTNEIDETKETESIEDANAPADFEKAIETCEFGLYNMLLYLVMIPTQFALMFQSSTISYILPIAECDLKLTLFDKGVLNAMAYAGMIVSAVPWGYLADTKGRKKVLAYGYLADAVCVFGSALSQNFEMLVAFKFLGGLIINGPGAVLFTYISELHSSKQRARALMTLGCITSVGLLAIPLLAWGVFPRQWDFVLFGRLNIHTWQIFLFVSGLPSLLSGILMLIMPETPKFLMSQGRNAEALKVFQTIYAINTRKPRNTYPIKALVEEVPNRNANINEVIYTIEAKPTAVEVKAAPRTFIEALRDGLKQVKPLFRKPLLLRSIHCYALQFCILLGLNTIRLWLPQLFASIGEFEAAHQNDAEMTADMCTILEYNVNKTANVVVNYAITDPTCSASKNISVDMYMNNIIVAATGLIGYLFAGVIVQALGAKRLLTIGLFISGCCGMSLYWSTGGLMTLIISSTYVTVCCVATYSLLGIIVALFPTQMRSLIVAITMMFGRLGALSGNILFPVFVEIGCIPPFLMVCLMLLCAAALSVILPNPKKENFT